MKNATSVTAVKIFDDTGESPPVQKTTSRISGAKIAVRLNTRAIEGLGISRPPRRGAAFALVFPSFGAATGFSTGISSPSSVRGQVDRKLDQSDAEWADVVVTMGCGDACPYIPGTRYVDWELEDPSGRPSDEVRRIRDDIAGRTRALAAELDAQQESSTL